MRLIDADKLIEEGLKLNRKKSEEAIKEIILQYNKIGITRMYTFNRIFPQIYKEQKRLYDSKH